MCALDTDHVLMQTCVIVKIHGERMLVLDAMFQLVIKYLRPIQTCALDMANVFQILFANVNSKSMEVIFANMHFAMIFSHQMRQYAVAMGHVLLQTIVYVIKIGHHLCVMFQFALGSMQQMIVYVQDTEIV